MVIISLIFNLSIVWLCTYIYDVESLKCAIIPLICTFFSDSNDYVRYLKDKINKTVFYSKIGINYSGKIFSIFSRMVKKNIYTI